jgi:predicted ATP-dependent endonuclease of OLD family
MQLTGAHVTLFKSIEDSSNVSIDSEVTILVGQNESGKTAFLNALYKARPVEENITYNIVNDYPRHGLTAYEKIHPKKPATVVILQYLLNDDEVDAINQNLGLNLFKELTFSVTHKYGGKTEIDFTVPEKTYIKHLIDQSPLNADIKAKGSEIASLKELITSFEKMDLNAESKKFVDDLKQKFGNAPENWSMLKHYIWTSHLTSQIPKFLYFDDYKLLPGKVNLTLLHQRFTASKTNKQILTDEDKTVLSLLNLANVDINNLIQPSGYEESKARLEAISNSITDKVFEYWTQNKELEVELDIESDPKDQPPFNSGNNLYIRIRSTRHRVSVPFDQRSKGFIWFFSFLVWFDSIKEQLGTDNDLILLLDEPGLSLHALAQADFLHYIDELSREHQIIYTTHSPFMVPENRLNRVRMVEDLPRKGTKVTDNISKSDPKTIFPLQAALGYTIAQNLFISKKNLLVEGPADLIYLQFFASILEKERKSSLKENVTIVPVGGLDKLATFVALLGGNQLETVILHDFEKKPDPRLESLIHEKIIEGRKVLHYAMFRNIDNKKGSEVKFLNSDIEDLLSPVLYLGLFNEAYKKELGGKKIELKDLPENDRIAKRIELYLERESIQLRPSGGFNHYLVASYLANNPIPISSLDDDTLLRFEQLFTRVNSLYSKED